MTGIYGGEPSCSAPFPSSCQVSTKCLRTTDEFHIQIRQDSSEQVCDSCRIRQDDTSPSTRTRWNREYLNSEVWSFELVIRLGKSHQLALCRVSHLG